METTETVTKSSNEILTELFGAFNAEPPKIKTKHTSGSDTTVESKRVKKSKKSKKSKKKHKVKKHKRKKEEDEGDPEKKKKRKHKKSSCQSSVNIELPVNKVPMALEIMLDGTVGIKGEDGTVMKIPDVCDGDKKESGLEPVGENGEASVKEEEEQKSKNESQTEKNDTFVPELFEPPESESSEKQKKGKIQIKDLKFSAVYQETVKAVEEQKKKEEEKKANYEEGELSDSTEDENEKTEGTEMSKSRSDKERPRHRYRTHSRHHVRKENFEHLAKRKRSRSQLDDHSRSHRRHHSQDRSVRKRRRSGSRDHYSHHSRDGYRRRSPSIDRSHYSRNSSGRSRDSHRSRSRSCRSRSNDRRKSRSRRGSKENRSSKDRSESVEKIDKEKLLAIARKNALKLIGGGTVSNVEKMAAAKAGGKTVNELTEYCKKLSEKDALGDNVSDIESESSEDEEKPFHHPFQVKDRPSSIIMNIKNAIPLPVKSLQEKAAEQAKQLRLQFPVSSGTSHRRTVESEWIPVSPPKKEEPVAVKTIPVPPKPQEQAPLTLPPNLLKPLQPCQPPQPPVYLSAVPPPEMGNKPVFPIMQPNPSVPNLDLSSLVSKRLDAIRKLQENPNDPQALTQMYSAQQEMQYWAELKQETGAFTGSTGAKLLTPSELSSGAHAWAKRLNFLSMGFVLDGFQLTKATPVKGGMGMALLQKMGWQPGEGLGKNKEGTLEPLKLEVKTDKKGLVAQNEFKKVKKFNPMPVASGLPSSNYLPGGKHPVSLLNELCSKRRYGAPQFELCFECGPDHKKNFLFKVKVNGIQYAPQIASPNKKRAKAEAAAICLRALGVLPDTSFS